MSLYEPNSAEQNEALHINLDSTNPSQAPKASQNAELILRLPDLEQIDAKPQKAAARTESVTETQTEEHQYVETGISESERWDTELASDSKFYTSNTKLPGKSRRGKIIAAVSLLLLAGFVGLGFARLTAGFYDSVPECENPAPDAAEAPTWKQPEYASGKSATQGTTSSKIPSDLTPPSLSLDLPGQAVAAKEKKQKKPSAFAPPAFPKVEPSQTTASSLAVGYQTPAQPMQTKIPVGPNMAQTPVFNAPNSATTQAQPTEADRFSPERIQAVLKKQQGSIPTMKYPPTQPAGQGTSTTNYPQTQVPVVAQRQDFQQHYPAPVSPYAQQASPYTGQTSPQAATSVSTYPPVTQNYNNQNWQNQNWPGQQTVTTPSTPQQSQQYNQQYSQQYNQQYSVPQYPTTGASVPNTSAQQPYYQQPNYQQQQPVYQPNVYR